MEIRYMSPSDDRLEISRIYESSWRHAYRGIVPQDYLDAIPAGRWVTGLDDPERHTLVCVEDGRLVGTGSFCRSRFEDFPGWGEIISAYLLPEYMGRGFGRALFGAEVAELRRLGFRDIFLWVLEDNHRARCFYEGAGFLPTGGSLEDCIGGKKLRELSYACRSGAVSLRKMTVEDIPLFRRWLAAAHVARWYKDPEDWLAEAEGMDGEYSWIKRFIAELDGVPVGFCQYYAARDSGEEWLRPVGPEGVYSLDYLIGEADALRRGLGKQLLRLLLQRIELCGDARLIAVQPERDNTASRALLRSCGFREADEASGIFVKERLR